MSSELRLKTCCRVGDVVGLKQLCATAKNLDVDYVDERKPDDVTGLWLATEGGKLDTVNVLLDYGADINYKRGTDGASVLYVACQNGHAALVDRLLMHPGLAGVDQRKQNGTTPLLISAQQGFPDIVEKLLGMGANPNVKNEQDVTAFMLACFMGNASLAVMLLRSGADHRVLGSGKTGLEWAKARKHRDVVAAVHHFIAFVQPINLFSVWLSRFWKAWMGTAAANVRSRRSDAAPAAQAAADDGEGSQEESEEGEEAKSLQWSIRDLPEGDLDYEPLELEGEAGNRLRQVIIPVTLQDQSSDEDEGTPSLNMTLQGRTAFGYEYAETVSDESTVWDVPSVYSQEDRVTRGPYTFQATHGLPSTHRYMKCLENAYEAEFGKPDYGDDVFTVMEAEKKAKRSAAAAEESRRPRSPRQRRADEEKQRMQWAGPPSPKSAEKRKYAARVDSAFRALFPIDRQRHQVQTEYINQDVTLTRTLHMAAAGKGKGYSKTSVSEAMMAQTTGGPYNGPMVSEHRSMKVGAKVDVFSQPSDGRLRGDGRSTWKKELREQKAMEKQALRAANAGAVIAKVEREVLVGAVHAPDLRARINKSGPAHTTHSHSRDTHCSRGYAKFFAKEFS